MSFNDAFDTQKSTGRPRGRLYFWALLALLFAVGAWLIVWPHKGLEPDPEAGLETKATPTSAPNGAPDQLLRPMTLFFADRSARALISEQRDLRAAEGLEERVEVALTALAEGPHAAEDALAVLPRESRVMQTFYDEETARLYVDFNTALITQAAGGSAGEYFALSALVRTVAANFPEVASLQILVDQQPVESLAGHYDTSKPLAIATWE